MNAKKGAVVTSAACAFSFLFYGIKAEIVLRTKEPCGTFDVRLCAGADLLATSVVVLEKTGVVAWCNAAAEMLFGVSRRNLTGSGIGQWLPAVTQWLSHLPAQGDKFSPYGAVAELCRPMTDPEPVYATLSPLAGSEGYRVLEITAVHDAMQLVREEEQAGMNEATKALLRNLAHEVKNPLGGIRGAAQLLDAELATSEERDYTAVIISEADRLQSLVDRLLVPYRRERRVGPVNILEVLERVRNLLTAEFPAGLVIRRDYDVSAPEITGDKEQLIQIFLNLMRNAVQAMHTLIDEGRAEITLKTRIARQVTIQRKLWRMALSVEVIDNGPGIDPAIREKIFYPLVTGRDGGTGLGLSLVKTYVDQHGAAIDAESEPGRTDFRLLFPLKAA